MECEKYMTWKDERWLRTKNGMRKKMNSMLEVLNTLGSIERKNIQLLSCTHQSEILKALSHMKSLILKLNFLEKSFFSFNCFSQFQVTMVSKWQYCLSRHYSTKSFWANLGQRLKVSNEISYHGIHWPIGDSKNFNLGTLTEKHQKNFLFTILFASLA